MPADPKNLTVLLDRTSELTEALRKLADSKVMVGIPSDDERAGAPGAASGSDARRGGDVMTNAALGYIHEHGSPAQGIPARPFLDPGVRNSRDRWLPYMQQAGQLAVDGKSAAVDRALHAAGTTAVSAVKATITAKIPPPLRPATVAARRRRSRGSKYRRLATKPDDTTPLIDTTQLLNSITYVVRRPRG